MSNLAVVYDWSSIGVLGFEVSGTCKAMKQSHPKGPKIEKNSRSPSGIEIFNRDWKFQASHPPNPYFSWGNSEGEDWKFQIEIENFERDWNFQSRLNFFNLWALGGHEPVIVYVDAEIEESNPYNVTRLVKSSGILSMERWYRLDYLWQDLQKKTPERGQDCESACS